MVLSAMKHLYGETAISEGALDSKLPHAGIAASGKDNDALASLDTVRRE
jgi:hypothetical protein